MTGHASGPGSKPRFRWWLAAVSLALLAAGCATAKLETKPEMLPLGQSSFGDYQRETMQWLDAHRNFQTPDHPGELARNSPAEWRPEVPAGKGILLLHGLGDSPWSFVDVGQQLASQGFLVRTVLLPGHGSKPADLIGVDVADWRRVLKEQVALLKAEVPQVMLGGFSTGANLALDYALVDEDISGLVLFSPALKSLMPVDWALPWLARLTPWLRQPDSGKAQQTPVRYLNVPTNGFAQFYQSSASVRQKISGKTYDKPVLLVLAEHDSVVDVAYVLDTFERRFTHPASRVIWYGELPGKRVRNDERVLVRPDRLPEARISQFSHMGVLFSPANPLYGRDGSQRVCWNGQCDTEQLACLAGVPVWYSEWGYREAGKVHARLTWNPWFEWQTGVMKEVLGHAL